MERLARTWADNDTPMSLAHFTEDAVYIEPPDLQRYKGHIELRLFFNELTVSSTMKWHNLWFDEATQRGAGEYSFSLGGWENQANHGVAIVEMLDGKIAVWREYQRRGVASFESFVGEGSGSKEVKQDAASIDAGMSPTINSEMLQRGVLKLRDLLDTIPGVSQIETSGADEPEWWVMFSIDIKAPIAWHVVQELGHILNYISVSERLPTLFMPVSPPPYLNGGPGEYLSWIIETKRPGVDAREIARVLAERLPDPIDSIEAWLENDEDEDGDEDDE